MQRSRLFKRTRTALPALLGAATLAAAVTSAAGAQAGGPVSGTDPGRLPRPVTVSISDVTVREPLSNPELPDRSPSETPARFTVRLSHAYSGPVTVKFRTVDGTAKAGSDYTSKSGTVTIPAGATSANIDVMVKKDHVVEADESFTVELGGVTNVIGIPIADGRGLGTIVDNTF